IKGNQPETLLTLLTDQTTSQPDVWTELRELRNMVVEQRVQLASAESTVQSDVSAELRQLRDMVVEQKVKLQQIEELKKENAGKPTDYGTPKQQTVTFKFELTNHFFIYRVSKSHRTEDIFFLFADTPKVAFSFGTGISGSHGPLSTDSILVLNREITNIGNAFSPITGVFTAPVRGVYYFRYTMSGHSSAHWTTVRLMKNQRSIVVATKPPKGTHDYAASGATLLLEKGDLVYLRLPANSQFWDDQNNHFSFSGFLLFTM
uniref:C1q domain-containing protein n=1 Tax=Astyanax mexicanus TaxID=7994 RepID=A0A8B9KI70_ASTMX